MKSEILTFHYPNQQIQRVQKVELDDFNQIEILQPTYDRRSFDHLVDLYRDFIIKKFAPIFGKIILFTLPQDFSIPFSDEDQTYGKIYDPLVVVHVAFQKGIKIKKGKLVFLDVQVKQFYDQLQKQGCLACVSGKRNTLTFLPVSHSLGFLSNSEISAKLKVNSSFFVMDRWDCATVYDTIGTPIGLQVKNGEIYRPAQFDREALLVDQQGKVSIQKIHLNQLSFEIDQKIYKDGINCKIYSRPQHRRTCKGGCDLVICDNRVVAMKKGGDSIVCSSGFVLHLNQGLEKIEDSKVKYHGLEDCLFAIQVGNSVMIEGKKTTKFISPFYHFLHPFQPSYPPSMYPLNYQKARAPRIVLGTNRKHKPILLWFEGAGKFGYQPNRDSVGASLQEVCDICEQLEIENAVHLDGGGSAQILLEGQRALRISDRDPIHYAEKERAVASGLMIR